MACPNYQATIEMLKAQYPTEWANAHTGNAHTEDFVRIVAKYLRAHDPNVGLNGKRGNLNDISDDALNILDPLDGPGKTPDGRRCWVVDFIKDAGLPTAAVTWQPFTDPVASSGANVDPGAAPIPPVPQPPPVVVFPPRNETMAAFDAINLHYQAKGRQTRTVTPPELYIDNEGIAVWLQQYLLYRVNGQSHQAAVDQVVRDIDAAWS